MSSHTRNFEEAECLQLKWGHYHYVMTVWYETNNLEKGCAPPPPSATIAFEEMVCHCANGRETTCFYSTYKLPNLFSINSFWVVCLCWSVLCFFLNLDLFSFFCMCCEYIMLHFEVDYIFLFFTSGLCSAPFESYFHTSAKPTSKLTCTKHITHNSLRRL